MRIRIWIAAGTCVALALVSLAQAGGSAAVRKRAELSTLLTGTIDIAPDGTVAEYRIDRPEKFHSRVVELVGKTARRWRFEPILLDGRAVRARTKMAVRVAMKPREDKAFELRIAGATFGGDAVVGEEVTRAGRLKPPAYPLAIGLQGTVYLILKIDREGKVADVVDEQVNLRVLANGRKMETGRNILAQAACAAAKDWRFHIPTRGPQAHREFWSVRVPVDFRSCDSRFERCKEHEEYGAWEAYIPGPRKPVPWLDETQSRESSDAMVAGELYPAGNGPKLLPRATQG